MERTVSVGKNLFLAPRGRRLWITEMLAPVREQNPQNASMLQVPLLVNGG